MPDHHRDDDYEQFLMAKTRQWVGSGIQAREEDFPPIMFPFQRALAAWAVRKGRAAIWADTGLGKTFIQLAWADKLAKKTLIIAPLCVSLQTVEEGKKLGVVVGTLGSGERIEITNYERLHLVDPDQFEAVVLDESSILKALDGKTRRRLIKMFGRTPYRLCCTATPAPNDPSELGNHAEFLGVMTYAEMLATFFVHDEEQTGRQIWRLKGHAATAFYRWLATWGMFLHLPSDLGFSDDGYRLPPLTIRDLIVGEFVPMDGNLFPGLGLGGIRGRIEARRRSLADRVGAAVELVRSTPGPWIVWCGLNDESRTLTDAIPYAQEVTGSDSLERKESIAQWFSGKLCLCKHANRSLSTCDSGPSGIDSESANMSVRDLDNVMLGGGGDTPRMRPTEFALRPQPRHGNVPILTVDSDSDSSSMGSRPKTSGASSRSKAEPAPSARKKRNGSRSITVIQRSASGGSCAFPATSASASSARTPISSGVPQCTCGYQSGRRVLISKPAIFGHGLNFQHCAQMAFLGLGDSFELYYQAIRRCWRYGQALPTTAWIIVSPAEMEIVENVRRKERDHAALAKGLIDAMAEAEREEIGAVRHRDAYLPLLPMEMPPWLR